MEKGICLKKRKIFGLITVTGKGQIAIPTLLRKELDIKKGDKLIVIKRDDEKGVNLLKVDIINNFLKRLSKD